MKITYVLILTDLLLKPCNVTGSISMDHREKYQCAHGIYKNKLLPCDVGQESSGSCLPPQPHLASLSPLNKNFPFPPVCQAQFCWGLCTCYFTCLNSDSDTLQCVPWGVKVWRFCVQLKLLSAQNRLLKQNRLFFMQASW